MRKKMSISQCYTHILKEWGRRWQTDWCSISRDADAVDCGEKFISWSIYISTITNSYELWIQTDRISGGYELPPKVSELTLRDTVRISAFQEKLRVKPLSFSAEGASVIRASQVRSFGHLKAGGEPGQTGQAGGIRSPSCWHWLGRSWLSISVFNFFFKHILQLLLFLKYFALLFLNQHVVILLYNL